MNPETYPEKTTSTRTEIKRLRMIAVVLALSTIISVLCVVYAVIKNGEAERMRQLTLELRVQALEAMESAKSAREEAEKQTMLAHRNRHEALRALEECKNKK